VKVFIAVAICKILYFIGSRVGRGSSLSGQIAMKVCPGALKRLKLPKTVIAVTGSNGKTSTVEFIARALEAGGMSVGWNYEGSNQIEGVATLLLRTSSLRGKVRRDALVLECDERYAKAIFGAVKPTVLVVTNLCRDQLTRNGHHEFIFDRILSAIEAAGYGAAKGKAAGGGAAEGEVADDGAAEGEVVGGGVTLVLNADDPYVAAFAGKEGGIKSGNRVVWFGVGRGALCPNPSAGDALCPNPSAGDALCSNLSTGDALCCNPSTGDALCCNPSTGDALCCNPSADDAICPDPLTGGDVAPIYDDGAFCPVCKGRMAYGYRIAGHYGDFACCACGHSHHKLDIEVTALDLLTGEIALDAWAATEEGRPGARPSVRNGVKTRLRLPSVPGAYNLAAAIAAVAAAGLGAGDAARALDGFELEGGRTVRFSAGGSEGVLLISKHENSMSYNQSMAWIVGQRKPCTVIVMVDSISRKYYTSETSWLWDVDFDILGDGCVQNVVLAGRYFNELMARFAMSAVDLGKCSFVGDIAELRGCVAGCGAGPVYAITCFADKAKLLKAFE